MFTSATGSLSAAFMSLQTDPEENGWEVQAAEVFALIFFFFLSLIEEDNF